MILSFLFIFIFCNYFFFLSFSMLNTEIMKKENILQLLLIALLLFRLLTFSGCASSYQVCAAYNSSLLE